MDESTLNNKNQHQNSSFEELVAAYDAGEFRNIQIILSKTGSSKFGQKYLMVLKSGFSIVRILDVDFEDNRIHIDLEDSNTGTIKHLDFDVHDNKFRYLFILWDDLKSLVYEENACNITNDDLLELETD